VADRLLRLPEAERDLDDIWLRIAEDNVRAADRLIDQIWQAEKLLLDHPRAGRPREDLAPGLRSRPVGAYLIFYRPEPGQITIVRVIWGGRNLPKIFRPA
jgi:toxin ParE1/3/4